MGKATWIPGVVVLVAAQVGAFAGVSCTSTPPTDGAGGSGGTKGSGGTGGNGGSGGSAGTQCREFDADQGDCGTCTATIQSYCSVHDCDQPESDALCWPVMEDPRWAEGQRLVATGCGYFRLDWWSNSSSGSIEPPVSTDVWDEATGELVYHFSRSETADCIPDLVAGTKPECDDSTEVCDSGYPCPLPDHFECFGGCFTGCVAAPTTCAQMEALCSGGEGGAGGEGGFGGGLSLTGSLTRVQIPPRR